MKKHKQNSCTFDLAEKWKKIKQSDIKCYDALIKMSRISCKHGQNNKPFSFNVPLKVINSAIRSKLIIIENGKVSFNGDSKWYYAICEYIYERILKKSWKDDLRLWKAIRAIFLLGYDISHDELAADVIVVAHNIYNMDVIKRIGELCSEKKDCWNLLHAFAKALPKLKVDVKSLKKTLYAMEPIIRNDLAGIDIYDSIERLCELKTDIAEELYDELISEKKIESAGFIVNVIKGIARTNFKKAFSKALLLSESNSIVLMSSGLIAIGSLDYRGPSKQDFLSKTLKLYKKMRRKKNAIVISSIVKGYGRLLKYTDEPKDALLKLSEKSNPEVLYEIAVVLLLNRKEHSQETWFEKTFINLAGIDSKHKGIIQKLDSTLSSIVELNADLVMSFWEEWSLRRDYGKNDDETLSIFKMTMSSINRRCFKKTREFYTKWFNSDEHKLHLAASDLIKESYHLKNRIPNIIIELDHDMVKKMSNRDVIYVIYKILGYVSAYPEALCSLVFSLIEAGCNDKMVISYVATAFQDYIGYNYARTTIVFLKIKAKSKNKLTAKVARSIKKEIDLYHESLKKLSSLKELQSHPQRVREMEQAKAKHFGRAIYKGAKKQSVLLQFCNEIYLKAGSSFIMEKDGKFSSKTEMKSVSHSIEYPRGEILDPIGQEFSRLKWRNLKREDLPCS